jgi:benzoylformate decarboxylase
MGPLSRIQTQTRDILAAYDLMIVVGADPLRMSVFSESSPLPDEMAIVQIGLVDHDIAKNYPAEIAVKADVRETLRVLNATLSRRGGAQLTEKARERTQSLQATNWTARRSKLAAQIASNAQRTPIDPDWLALQVVDALPPDAILVDEGLTSSRYIPFLRAHKGRYDYHALASGGIGWSLPASVGVSLANPGRPVVCYTGDGSAMYSIQALWTAAHHKLPLTVVLINNGGYRIIKQRLRAFHKDERYIGMDFDDPPVDFTAVARGLGLEVMRIDAPDS